ncbi:MAG: tyrosine-type recombinase/integrase [Alphaproteobacteria bacterium]|nr:tyrosine-type recombinase/integrase [Alphaproteobacteria bacterium]
MKVLPGAVSVRRAAWLERVFGYSARNTAREPWHNETKRAGIKYLAFHCCRHGFATTLLHKGVDVVTIAKLGGWKDVAQVVKTYGHAMTDPTITAKIIDTKLAQHELPTHTTHRKKRKDQ